MSTTVRPTARLSLNGDSVAPIEESRIRLARPTDEAQLMAFMPTIHDENGLGGPYDDVPARCVVRQLIAREGGVVVVITEDGIDTMIGATLGLALTPSSWSSSAMMLHALWSYVTPIHRRSVMAKTLLQTAKRYSDQLGVPLMLVTPVEDEQMAKVRLCRRQLPEVGAVFSYNHAKPAPAMAK